MASNKKIPGRERQPIAGAAKSLLNTVKLADNSKTVKDPKIQDVIDKVVKCFEDSAQFNRDIASAESTASIEQVRALINTLNVDQIQPAIESIKDELSPTSFKNIMSSLLMSQLNTMLEDAYKSNSDDIKEWISNAFSESNDAEAAQKADKASEGKQQASSDETKSNEPLPDNTEGEYQDSTPAVNFQTLQDFVNRQFDSLNDKFKNVPGQSGILSKMSSAIGGGFSKLFNTAGKLSKSMMGGIGRLAKSTTNIFSIVGNVASGIKGIGAKIGGAIAKPVKKIGGFFSAINPFKKSDERKEKQKAALKKRFFNAMSNIINKIWGTLKPFITKVALWGKLIALKMIIPIAVITAKVLLIAGAVIALGIAAYLAYSQIKEKIASFWKYITSGKILDDIVSGLTKAWEWLVDFGGWLWDTIVDALADFGKWIWKQLCRFGRWLYDKFIFPYIVKPVKTIIGLVKSIWEDKIQPVVQPFIDSLTNLKDKIVKAFSAWDTNKSIWENLKNIGGIIKDSIVEWWKTSPFKKAYDEHIKPMVDSVGEFISRIKDIWKNFKWDENKSFIENLSGLGETLVSAITKWWNNDNNPIKQFYNQWIKPIFDAISDAIRPFIEKVKEIWNKLKMKMGNIVLKVPFFGFIRPFGPMAGLPVKLSSTEADDYVKFSKPMANIDEEDEKLAERMREIESRMNGKYFRDHKDTTEWHELNKQRESLAKQKKKLEADLEAKQTARAKELAQQQVAPAIKTVQSIKNTQTEAKAQTMRAVEKVSSEVQEKEDKKSKEDQKMAEQLAYLRKDNAEIKATLQKDGQDPRVYPLPYFNGGASTPAKNTASMPSLYGGMSMINMF